MRHLSRDTKCKNCIFATYEDDTQTGCSLNMIEQAENNNVEVLDCYDEDKEFHVLANRQCMFYRNSTWASKLEPDNYIQKIQQEIAIPFQALILADEKSTLADIEATIESLEQQILKPSYVLVVREFANKTKPIDIAKLFTIPQAPVRQKGMGWSKKHKVLPLHKFKLWKVENPIDNSRTGRKLMDLALHTNVHPYVALFRAGRKVPDNFFSTLNDKLNSFFQFGIITNKHDLLDGIVISRNIFLYYGNTLVEIEQCLKDSQCQKSIHQIQQVIPTFK